MLDGLVSVIVPCYNGAAFLQAAIDSAVGQSYKSLEVIVVDDGSTDRSREIAESYGGRVRVVVQANRGLPAARNAGIEIASGELLAFLDADDRWLPEKIAKQVQRLSMAADVGFVHTERVLVDDIGRRLPSAGGPGRARFVGECLLELVRGNNIAVSSVLVRRSTLAELRFERLGDPKAPACEDWDLWLKLAERTRFAFVPEPLTEYRQHGTNMSSNVRRMRLAEIACLDGVLARNSRSDVHLLATEILRGLQRQLFALEVERGDWTASLKALRRAWPSIGLPELKLGLRMLRAGLRRHVTVLN